MITIDFTNRGLKIGGLGKVKLLLRRRSYFWIQQLEEWWIVDSGGWIEF
jgi:hypothetical protein